MGAISWTTTRDGWFLLFDLLGHVEILAKEEGRKGKKVDEGDARRAREMADLTQKSKKCVIIALLTFFSLVGPEPPNTNKHLSILTVLCTMYYVVRTYSIVQLTYLTVRYDLSKKRQSPPKEPPIWSSLVPGYFSNHNRRNQPSSNPIPPRHPPSHPANLTPTNPRRREKVLLRAYKDRHYLVD